MENKIAFNPLERADLADRIVGEIKAQIAEGKLLPGDRLPTERELSQQFGVSRTCVREALHSLETLGLLKSHVRTGTYLEREPDALLENLSWVVFFGAGVEKDLLEAREVLEPAIAALAAKNAAPEDIRDLEEHLERMRASLGDARQAAERDFEFHVALAKATHNAVLQRTLVGMQWILRGYILKKLEKDRNLDCVCYNEHQRIFEAVRDRDSERAYEAMRESVAERKLRAGESRARESAAGRDDQREGGNFE